VFRDSSLTTEEFLVKRIEDFLVNLRKSFIFLMLFEHSKEVMERRDRSKDKKKNDDAKQKTPSKIKTT
jgi:hypothetical protein